MAASARNIRFPLAHLLLALALCWSIPAAWAQNATDTNRLVLLHYTRKAQTQAPGTEEWQEAVRNQPLAIGGRVRTLQQSQAFLEPPGSTTIELDQLTTVEIRKPGAEPWPLVVRVQRGRLLGLSLESVWVRIETPAGSIEQKATGFQVEVGEDGATTLTMVEGEAELTNAQGRQALTSREQGHMRPGQAPQKSARLDSQGLIGAIQWALYYPGVLSLDDLEFDADQQRVLAGSFASYRAGAPRGSVGVVSTRASTGLRYGTNLQSRAPALGGTSG